MSDTFAYACLLPFAGNLFMIPGVLIFGVSINAQIMGMILFACLFATVLFFSFRKTGWSVPGSLLAASVVLLLVSSGGKLREIYWGHIIYYSIGVFYLMTGYILCACLIRKPKVIFCDKMSMRDYAQYILLVIWFILGAANGTPVLTLFSLPILGAFILVHIFDENALTWSKDTKKQSIIFLLVVAATVIGIVFGKAITAGMVADYQEGTSVYSSADNWVENIQKLYTGWFTLLGMEPGEGIPITSAEGIFYIIRSVVAVIMAAAPILLLVFYRKIKDSTARFFLWASLVMSGLLLFGWLFGRLSGVNWRLSPLVCITAILVLFLCRFFYQSDNRKRFATLLMIPVCIVCIQNSLDMWKIDSNVNQDDAYHAVITSLEDKGLTYGYAEYWNAATGTVLTENKVKIRSITVQEDSISRRDYQSDSTWYQPQEGVDRYFLLLTQGEFDKLRENGCEVLDQTIDSYECAGYQVLIYDHYFL